MEERALAVAGMNGDAVDVLAALAGVVVAYVAIACARAWMARPADLNISIFRPWRGDPWPVGVQEDDDFRFQWSAAATGAAIVGPPASRGATRRPGDASKVDASPRGPIEDISAGSVSVERVVRINVRRTGS